MGKFWPPDLSGDHRSKEAKAVDNYIESILKKQLATEDGAVPRKPKKKSERRPYEKTSTHNPLWVKVPK